VEQKKINIDKQNDKSRGFKPIVEVKIYVRSF
jgi:hypothetical protein